jgi:hypothetical protein
MNVLLDDDPDAGKTATVIVPDRQLSLAIGKEGQNARLAAKLTGWRIDIKSATETAEETLGRFEEAPIAREDMDLLTLAKDILRQRTGGELTEAERILIENELKRGGETVPDWPDLPEEAPIDATPETDIEAVPEVAEAEAVEEVVAAPSDAIDDAQATAIAEDLPSPEGEAKEPLSRTLVEDGAEAEPPFEGEPVAESTGWVTSEPSPEFQYGWEDEGESWEAPWETEGVDKEEEKLLKSEKKKKRKKRGRRAPEYEEGSDLGRWT